MNAPATQHPSPEQLAAFCRGDLGPESQAEIERHVAACDSCCDLLRVVPDDTLIGQLRAANSAQRDTIAMAAADTAVPRELADHPRYRVLRVIGSGGMGVVYQAEHRLMERMVALKVIRPSLLDRPAAIERFRTEARAAARLAHPNIVAAHDAEQAGNLHFLVMEYIPGASLAKVVEGQGPLPVADACKYIRQAALGLQHAWEQGMVHRDIKPQNLMLAEDGRVRILDFGLARLSAEQASAPEPGEVPSVKGPADPVTGAGVVLGTPDYIAPEQTLDSRGADIRADIYSLGCTLYFLLAGQAPFAQGSVTQKVAAHRERTPRPLSVVRPDVSPKLARIVERMMAKDPGARFQTPGEVAAALEPLLARRPPRLARVKQLVRARRRSVAIAAAVALLAGIAWLALGLVWPESRTGEGRHGGAAVAPSAAGPATVLVVLAPRDFWYPEYEAVRRELERAGARVVVASSSRAPAEPHRQSDGRAVEPDAVLGEADAAAYGGVVFIGGEGIREYMSHHAAGWQARRVIDAMRNTAKPIAAIGMGPGVLADARVLDGRRATGHDKARGKVEMLGGTWSDGPVVVDGNVVTARDPEAASAMVRELMRLLPGEK
jgi:putative intracellular protease/amidase/predicted Ser/Thr protein kinase